MYIIMVGAIAAHRQQILQLHVANERGQSFTKADTHPRGYLQVRLYAPYPMGPGSSSTREQSFAFADFTPREVQYACAFLEPTIGQSYKGNAYV